MWWSCAAVVLVACGTSEPGPALTFDPCAVTRVDAAGANAEQLASIDTAISMWSARGVNGLQRGEGAQVSLVFKNAAPSMYGFYDETTATVYVNLRITDPSQRAVVIAHELGHALGLLHVSPNVRSSVMNPGNVVIEPTDADAAALVDAWGACGGTPDAPATGRSGEGDQP